FITHPPSVNTWMIIMACNHLTRLLLGQLQRLLTWNRRLLPMRNLLLHEQSVAIAPIEQLLVPLPVEAGDYTIRMLDLLEELSQIGFPLRHSDSWIRAGHPFYAE